MEQVRWCEEPHSLVPSMLLSSLLLLSTQTSVDGSMERSESCVYAAYLCHMRGKAAVAMTMLQQCLKQQLYLFTCPAAGSPMPPFLSQQEWKGLECNTDSLLTPINLTLSEFHFQAFIFHPQSLDRPQTGFSCSNSFKDLLRHGLIKIIQNRLSSVTSKSLAQQSFMWLNPSVLSGCHLLVSRIVQELSTFSIELDT